MIKKAAPRRFSYFRVIPVFCNIRSILLRREEIDSIFNHAIAFSLFFAVILEKLLTQENRVLEYWTSKKKRLDQNQQFCLFERSARQSLAWIKEEGDIYLSTHTRVGANREETERLLREHNSFKVSGLFSPALSFLAGVFPSSESAISLWDQARSVGRGFSGREKSSSTFWTCHFLFCRRSLSLLSPVFCWMDWLAEVVPSSSLEPDRKKYERREEEKRKKVSHPLPPRWIFSPLPVALPRPTNDEERQTFSTSPDDPFFSFSLSPPPIFRRRPRRPARR